MEPTFISYAFVAGLSAYFGYWAARKQYNVIFKKFSDEMHKQYLLILEGHGVKLNKEGEKAVHYEPNNQSERKESLLQMWEKN